MHPISEAILAAADARWLTKARILCQRDDHEIYCFASPTWATILGDRYPYMPNWISLDNMSMVQAGRAAAFLGAPLARGNYDEIVGEWHPGGGAQVAISNRLAAKMDTVN